LGYLELTLNPTYKIKVFRVFRDAFAIKVPTLDSKLTQLPSHSHCRDIIFPPIPSPLARRWEALQRQVSPIQVP